MLKYLIALCLLVTSPVYAARDFDGSADKIEAGEAIIGSDPFTYCAWTNRDTSNVDMAVISTSTSGSVSDYYEMGFDNAATDRLFQRANDGSFRNALNSSDPTQDTWSLMCGYEAAANSRFISYDGANTATNSTTASVGTLDETNIGQVARHVDSRFWNGEITDAAQWSRVLDLAEMVALANGFSANCFPVDLTTYVLLVRDVVDVTRSTTWTTTGTTVTAHNRLFLCD